MNRLISPSSLAGPWSHGESAALEVQHKWPESSTSPASPACAKYAASQRPVSAVCSSGRCILRPPLLQSGPSPLHSLTSHMAAVKALAWCPWQPNILASGGGTADQTIKIWNASTGQMLSSTHTQSQVSTLHQDGCKGDGKSQ